MGSRQWIGSLECSFVLETELSIQSRILRLDNASCMVRDDTIQALLDHFLNSRCPIIMGGGVLAHTIVGICPKGANSTFLVVDPHYAGPEKTDLILAKGYCTWKPATFWSKNHYYNLCMPIVSESV
ncbi:hypothetical protein ACOME3_002457 [Neoechinorhynchus agilis]